MNVLHIMMMVNLTVPYPGNTTTGEVYNVEPDTAETFVNQDACNSAAAARNLNPMIRRNLSRYSVTRTVYRCVSIDPAALSQLEPSPMPENMRITPMGEMLSRDHQPPSLPNPEDHYEPE